ncbi:signal peptidase I [Arthrobacter sp. zg-Y916]|uniref:signal peptidase I n=1 Tax=Arthrobacter sp. zg-Y916 TaxID=2894190 RepID=UPI001E3D3030|nr:signal peptidase I [Arthrobacter sp. zg-Y916]MCC9194120.1 signal peptidase I [Arthrobacter sp. zg-Y916]
MSSGRSNNSQALRALKFTGSALSLVAMCVTALAALVLIIVPLLTGSQTYSVLTNSMAPKYAPGTFLVVKPTPADALQVGDVITYQIESGDPTVITHRIIGVGAGQSGERVFTTQGDNNDLADESPVQEVQIRGKLSYAVPYVGFIANGLGNSDRGAIAQWAAVGLLGYGIVLLVRGGLEKKRKGTEPDMDAMLLDLPPRSDAPAQGRNSALPRMHDDDASLLGDDPILHDCDHCDHEISARRAAGAVSVAV